MSKNQTVRRRGAKSEALWERRQVQAATAWSTIKSAEATIRANWADLEEDARQQVETVLSTRRLEVQEFLLKHRDLYLSRMESLGLPTTSMVGTSPDEEADWGAVTAHNEGAA